METIDQLNALITDHSPIAAVAAIIFATLVSEDLTCIGCGLLVSHGDLPLLAAMIACASGLWLGDLTLYGWGKFVGRPVLRSRLGRRLLREADVDSCSDWYNRRGAVVIFLARVVPGCRLPTYFAAGLLNASFLKFSLFAFLATAVWAPLLVWVSMVVGGEVLGYFAIFRKYAVISLILAVLAIYFGVKLVLPLFTYKGRRLLRGALRRKIRWEYWHPFFFYIPVIAYILFLAVKYGGLSLFTTVNPAIYAGGFVNESKSKILEGLAGAHDFVASTTFLPATLSPDERLSEMRKFMEQAGLDYPIVLKPDAGQRGSGVAVARSDDEALDYFGKGGVDSIAQEYADGSEFGIFYFRYPDAEKGSIFSITEKEFPKIVGDGIHTIEQMILRDRSLLAMASFYLASMAHRHYEVPKKGEEIRLIEIGSHCRGAVFRDGMRVWTPELEGAIDRISKTFDGFYFGRYDVRTPSIEDLQSGMNFKIIELNGATSEATHMYDPRHSLLTAYGILFRQWRILFEIAAMNHANGAETVPLRKLARLVFQYRHSARMHPA